MGENVDASAELARSLAQISVDCPWCPKGRQQRGLRSNHKEVLDGEKSDSDSEEEGGVGSEFHTEGWANWGGWG